MFDGAVCRGTHPCASCHDQPSTLVKGSTVVTLFLSPRRGQASHARCHLGISQAAMLAFSCLDGITRLCMRTQVLDQIVCLFSRRVKTCSFEHSLCLPIDIF